MNWNSLIYDLFLPHLTDKKPKQADKVLWISFLNFRLKLLKRVRKSYGIGVNNSYILTITKILKFPLRCSWDNTGGVVSAFYFWKNQIKCKKILYFIFNSTVNPDSFYLKASSCSGWDTFVRYGVVFWFFVCKMWQK